MAKPGRWSPAKSGLFVVAALSLAGQRPSPASSVEYRDYVVTVDGKEAGRTQVSITTQDDGTTVMAAKASIRVNKAVFSYAYDIHVTEWWKSGRLIGLKANSNDNGKKTEIVAAGDGAKLRIRVNALERPARPDLWVNSFWKLADERFHNNAVPVLDADTGREYTGQLQYIATEQVNFAGQALKCYRFRVTGGPMAHELWYDESHRLVRQEFVEQGRRVIVALSSLRR
jgi:hypothetical protein